MTQKIKNRKGKIRNSIQGRNTTLLYTRVYKKWRRQTRKLYNQRRSIKVGETVQIQTRQRNSQPS